MTIDFSGIGSAQVIVLLPLAMSSRINKCFLEIYMWLTRSIRSHHSRERASCRLVVIIFLLSDTGTLIIIIAVITAASQSEDQTKQDCGRNTHLCFLPSALFEVERQPAVHGCAGSPKVTCLGGPSRLSTSLRLPGSSVGLLETAPNGRKRKSGPTASVRPAQDPRCPRPAGPRPYAFTPYAFTWGGW
jgi:hypothetical protein